MGHLSLLLHSLLLILLQQATLSYSWGWFSSSSSSSTETHSNENPSKTSSISNGFVAEFSMETISNPKGIKLVENARQRSVGLNSCWRNAYGNLFTGCSEIITNKEKQSRLAWHLSDCFQKDSGRSPFPSCDTRTSMINCLKKLDEYAHTVYLEFFLETNSICHQLQADAFKHETERLVNDLKKSAQFTEEKLESMEGKSDEILENANQIHHSITSIDHLVEQVARTSKDVEEQIDVIMNYSKVIFDQSKEISASQSELQGGQIEMREKLESGIAMVHESYQNIGQDLEKLRKEAVNIEREINEVSNSMSLKMKNLENKADDIGNIAGLSLDKQKEILDGQSAALEGLDFLTKFQSQALEENRATLQNLIEFGRKQQQELLQLQEQLQQAHDRLVENSKSILAAQEAFELRQANMFKALDKLFALHNAILLESRLIKAFFFYSFAIFILYMLTSAKQTYFVRARLFLGLCATFLVEFAIVQLGNDLDHQTWIASKVILTRSSFLLVASIQILYSIFTYRDYEVLNHHMLVTLMEIVNTMERQKMLSLDVESDINLSSWIDTELPEDVDNCDDPDYIFPEEVAENLITTTLISRKYNLRPRCRR